mgnify:CR=1 FL=1
MHRLHLDRHYNAWTGALSRSDGVQSDALRFCQTDALHFRGADKHRTGNAETARLLRQYGVQDTDLITADSAEPKSVADYRSYGLFCRGAVKGPGSVDYSMKWLQALVADCD